MPQFWKIDFNGVLDTAFTAQWRLHYDMPNYSAIDVPTGLTFVYPETDDTVILF